MKLPPWPNLATTAYRVVQEALTNVVQHASRIVAGCPQTKVLALTVHEDTSYLPQLLAAGASGYMLKCSAGDVLIQALRAIDAGETYVAPLLAGVSLCVRHRAARCSPSRLRASCSLCLRRMPLDAVPAGVQRHPPVLRCSLINA